MRCFATIAFAFLILVVGVAQTAVEAPQKRVRVGITVCEHGLAQGGALHMHQIASELRDTSVDLIPVIEPQTQPEKETKRILDLYFENQKPLSVYDEKDLKTLDVLVVAGCWTIQQETMDAIESAAKEGLNLIVVSGVGIYSPRTNEQTRRLAGIEGAEFAMNTGEVACKVVAAHPLLGNLKQGDELTLCPNGMFGNFKDATALVQVNSLSDVHIELSNAKKEADMVFAPLYLSKLGKGTIVGVSWASWAPMPDAIEEATDGRFYERAALWLAGRPLPEKAKPDEEFDKYGVRFKRQSGEANGAIVEVLFSKANRADDAVMRQLTGFRKLERVYLENVSGITDAGVKTLSGIGSLKTLRLTNSKITDAGMVDLKGLTQLEWLDLTGSSITDESVADLKTLQRLRFLKVKRTRISRKGVEELQGALPECQIIR
jgi:hypothetical protein